MKRLAQADSAAFYHGGIWPSAPQQLLLRAALLEAPAAQAAWAAWLEMVEPDQLDSGSWRLIPLVYVNLHRLGVSHPLLLQARVCHLSSWRSNQKLFHQSALFLEELERLHIPALVLKGVALAHLYYPDTGARPMADLDVLVPAEHFLPLGRNLFARGWQETDGHTLADFEMETLPSFGFMREDGFWVDIHYHVLHAHSTRGAAESFWSHARSWTLRQKPTLALGPEDQLLHVIAHGLRWCDVPPCRWLADAWWVLARSRDTFDWEYLLSQARSQDVNLFIFRGLELLDQITPLALPPGLLGRLERLPVSAKSRVRFIDYTHQLPLAFLPRAAAIWKAAAETHPGYSIIGRPPPPAKRRSLWEKLGIATGLGVFFLKVVIRDRRQILAQLTGRGGPRGRS